MRTFFDKRNYGTVTGALLDPYARIRYWLFTVGIIPAIVLTFWFAAVAVMAMLDLTWLLATGFAALVRGIWPSSSDDSAA